MKDIIEGLRQVRSELVSWYFIVEGAEYPKAAHLLADAHEKVVDAIRELVQTQEGEG